MQEIVNENIDDMTLLYIGFSEKKMVGLDRVVIKGKVERFKTFFLRICIFYI